MRAIEVWGPVLRMAANLFDEASEIREFAKGRRHDDSYEPLTSMSDAQLRAACLGAAMAKYLVETDEETTASGIPKGLLDE